uniref:Neuronal acetylcholine receptor subunit alpha-7 n=1 Tax=Neogobius melanostomus TaxID=47308 RepID=A0A8C6TNP9_9GOBI
MDLCDLPHTWRNIDQFYAFHPLSLCLQPMLLLSVQGPHQRLLLKELLRDYNPMERPVGNDSQTLTVHFSFTLMQVMDVDEKNQKLTTNAWLQMQWYDHYLQWNQSEYPGVKNLRFTSEQVWTPDILLYNSAHDKFDATFKTNVLVNSSGFCVYLPPGIFVSTCSVDVRWFPFDIQRCELKFGSWTFDGWLLDMQMNKADVSGYMPNGEWELLGKVPGDRHEVFYDCCAEPYLDVTFVVTLRRRTLFYALNLLIPCVLLSSMTLVVFLLPANSGEKISLGITVLLSLTVFMLMVAEIMPATSDSVPLIGQYFASTMVIVGMSVVATVIVLQFHHHNPNDGHMPRLVNLILLQWVPWFLRMKRPGENADPPLPHNHGDVPSKGLASPTTSATTTTIPTPVPSVLPQSLASLQASLAQLNHPLSADTPTHGQHNKVASSPHEIPLTIDPELASSMGAAGAEAGAGGTSGRAASSQSNSIGASSRSGAVDNQLRALLGEVQYLVERVREQDRQMSVSEQWQFAAAVVDRLCLVGFSVFNIICTIAILMAAPNFGEALSKDFL